MLYENKNYAKKAREKAAEIEAMLKRQARMTDGGQVKRSQRSVTLYLRCLAISTAQSKYAARMLFGTLPDARSKSALLSVCR